MAAIHDLLKQIGDARLRERLAREWKTATRNKKFGLVYEQHLPELVPIYNSTPRRGDLVARRSGSMAEVWRVRKVEDETAVLIRPRQAGERLMVPLADLLVVKQFGEPIFPTLTPVDAVQNGPEDAVWHTLIEGDNYHALQLLEYLYAGRVDCIYIDPPYNSGARDWKYNNNYVDKADSWRHSKWLSMMAKRLALAKRLLRTDDGIIVITIDEHEVHHLGVLLEDIFPEYVRQMLTIVINPKGTGKANFARVEEHALFCIPDVEGGVIDGVGKEEDSSDGNIDDTGDFLDPSGKSHLNPNFSHLWEKRHARRRGSESSYRHQRWNQFYPIFVDEEETLVIRAGKSIPLKDEPDFNATADGLRPIWPIDHGGNHRCWRFVTETMQGLIEQERVVLGKYNKKKDSWTINIWEKKPQFKKVKTVWWNTAHDAGTHGTTLLHNVLNERGVFAFPKSIYAVRDTILPVVGNRPNAIIVDFFAGSGTTLSAVNLINQADGGKRSCLMVTNNEISAKEVEKLAAAGHSPGSSTWEAHGICKSVTWPRSKFTILGRRDDGTALPGEYLTGRMVDKEKPRSFRHLTFVSPKDFILPEGLDDNVRAKTAKDIVKKQKALVALIEGLPQNAVTEGCRFIAREDSKATVLFDPKAEEAWLTALDEQTQITDVFIVAESNKQFKEIKEQVENLLGPQIVQEEEKRPMADGFTANLAYFKLDFLDKDQVELGAAFREVLPLLWMRAGAMGPRPELPAGPLPDWLAPEGAAFAVLLHEARIKGFIEALRAHRGLSHVFIVTDAEEAFHALSEELRIALESNNPDIQLVQLYRDYLMNFMINTRVDEAPISARGTV